MRAKSFFYVTLGILALATAYHLGASTAGAQSGSIVTGVAIYPSGTPGYAGRLVAFTANGDVYACPYSGNASPLSGAVEYLGNFWGGATPTSTTTFGALKAKYR